MNGIVLGGEEKLKLPLTIVCSEFKTEKVITFHSAFTFHSFSPFFYADKCEKKSSSHSLKSRRGAFIQRQEKKAGHSFEENSMAWLEVLKWFLLLTMKSQRKQKCVRFALNFMVFWSSGFEKYFIAAWKQSKSQSKFEFLLEISRIYLKVSNHGEKFHPTRLFLTLLTITLESSAHDSTNSEERGCRNGKENMHQNNWI